MDTIKLSWNLLALLLSLIIASTVMTPLTAWAVDVNFPDPNLEAAIREELNKPEGPITDDELAKLTGLDASERGISDLTGIEYCINLKFLNLGYNQITDIRPLSALTKLQGLVLWVNRITDLSPLSNLTNLENWLNLEVNQITDISSLSGLTKLKSLSLGANQIGNNISPLIGLTNLQSLGLRDNQMSDIRLLTNLTNLHDLDLRGNDLSEISLLRSLTNLRELRLADTQLEDISYLSPLIELQRLDLAYNHIINISSLSNLTNLQFLSLGSNLVSDISPLSNLTDLRVFYLDNNQIIDISPLAELAMIGEGGEEWWSEERDGIGIALGLSDNNIVDMSPLVNNPGIGDGDGVDLRGNPFNYDTYDRHITALQRRGVNVLFDILRKDVYVAITGDDSVGDGSEENPFATIQKGIDIVLDEGTVWVSDGTYTGEGNRDLDFKGKAITLRSRNGAATTIIDCEAKGRGFYFHSESPV